MINHEKFQTILNKDFGESLQMMLDSTTFDQLCKSIECVGEKYHDYGYEDTTVEDDVFSGSLKLKGDLFEIFAEIFFKVNSGDNRISLFDYQPVSSFDDNGVDGTGKNVNGDLTTVQIKFRHNPIYLLKERDIKQFPFQSILKYGVDLNKGNNMIVFTNCKGLHWYTDSKVFENKIRVINGEFISKMIDNNSGFWNSAKNIVNQSLIQIGMDFIKIN